MTRQLQISNTTLADKILKGNLNLEHLRFVQNKKELSALQGKHSDVSVERFITKNIKEQKRKKLKKMNVKNKSGSSNAERMAYFKLKREPEKNKTHWDHLLEEMKWMENDFEKERKMKKKAAVDFAKCVKKLSETRHIEIQKQIKRQEIDLKRKSQLISRSINHYWRKIEKLAKYNYNLMLNENKMLQQQNRLMGFITKLQKISGRVAESLGPGVNQQIRETSVLGVGTPTKIQVDSDAQSMKTYNTDEEDIILLLKKNEDGTFSLLDNNLEENLVAKAAHCAEQFQPKGTQLKEANITLQQPFLLKNELREYQLIGLHWLIALHDNKINGILADEMGLGKTIQTIALFSYLAANRGMWGPHLIIVPTTIIVNWEIEFKKWCPSLKILSYFGNQKERKTKRYGWHKPNSFNVCITSYKLVIQDYSIFKRKKWYYIVLDEAQNIKNFKSKRWQMLLNFKAKRKLLLTGTPLQNDIMEIWSYLHFLMPNLFYSNEEFREWFYSQFYNAIHNNATLNKKLITSLHSILRPFLLRRLKKDVEKQLPEKIEHVVYCELSRRQRYLYDEYISTDKTQDTLKRNDYFSIMNVLMQLRKVCNHPDLFDSRDYVTPSKQMFEIFFYCPSLVVTMFYYHPLKSTNFRELNLLIEEYEKLSVKEYMSIIQYFPARPFHEIFEDLIRTDKLGMSLYQSKYLIDENDILFKRQYTDSTILYPSNSDSIMTFFRNYNVNGNPTTMNAGISTYSPMMTNLNSLGQANAASNMNFPDSTFNLPFPKYVCPTNIPLLQNSSMSNYYDILNPIDTTDLKDNQIYLKSVFQENINCKREIKRQRKKKLLHTYDLISRKAMSYLVPIYGTDCMKTVKLHFTIDYLNNSNTKSHILYGYPNSIQAIQRNTVNSTVLNKGFKYTLKKMPGFSFLESNRTYEGFVDSNNIDIIVSPEVDQKIDEANTNKDNRKPIPKRFIHQVNDMFTSESSSLSPEDSIFFYNSDAIHNMVYSPQKMLHICEDLMTNFRIYIPKVICSGPKLIPTKYVTEFYRMQSKYQMLYNNLNRIPNVLKYFSLFKIISFPDKKLVEYDSGKLIKLSALLKKLKTNRSKTLIFTQMTRMLDILEVFLNLHGLTYVRLDGSTKVELRQQIVDKFNNDAKVFCFISSTRSGGIGLNLTGADSIIFYDTDWNPAMDKQAQDRCHRIGQTRTVHIYRLITLSTIEENIFKKAIQKRELNYVVMEDGRFDTSHFSKINLKTVVQEENLIKNNNNFPHDTTADKLAKADDKIKKLLEFENLSFENEEEQKNIEQMLIRIEDHEDVQALKNLSKEMLDEYEKENNELQFINEEGDKQDGKDLLKERNLIDKLKPIDKFALKFYQEQFTFNMFIKEKEARTNINYFPSDQSENSNLDDDLEIGKSDSEDEKVNKLDLDQAYEMYLLKKKEIMKTFEVMRDDDDVKEEEGRNEMITDG